MGKRPGYVIFAFATPSHLGKAHRFCEALVSKTGFVLWKQSDEEWLFRSPTALCCLRVVPHVDESVAGTQDLLMYSKPVLVASALRRWELPVLYCDSDLIFTASPDDVVFRLLRQGADCAFYNHPSVSAVVPTGNPCRQMAVSGVAQLYAHTTPAKQLLQSWLLGLLAFRRVRFHIDDDEVLTSLVNDLPRSFEALTGSSAPALPVVLELNELFRGNRAALQHPDPFTSRDAYPLELLMSAAPGCSLAPASTRCSRRGCRANFR